MMTFRVILPGSQTITLEPSPWGWHTNQHPIDDSMKKLLGGYKGHFPRPTRDGNAQRKRVSLYNRPKTIPSTLLPTFDGLSRHRIQDVAIYEKKWNDFLLGNGRRNFEAERAEVVSLGESSSPAASIRPTSKCSTPMTERTTKENEKQIQLPLECDGISKIGSRLLIDTDNPPMLRSFTPPPPSDSAIASYDIREAKSGLSESAHSFQVSTTARSPLKGLEDIQYIFTADNKGDQNREDDEYEIKEICKHLPTTANRRNTKKYYICWAEGGQNTWEDAVDVGILAQDVYWEKLAETKRKMSNNRVERRSRRLRK
jgi:hypothetical protein